MEADAREESNSEEGRMMDANYYQQMTMATALYPHAGAGTDTAITYCLMGLGGEVGELQNKYKKVLRGDIPLDRQEFREELGDVLWYVARLAAELDADLTEIMATNNKKLMSRKFRGTIQGSGDNR